MTLIALLVTTFVLAPPAPQRSGSTIGSDRIFAAIGIREGATICEIGAGDGGLTVAAARLVGAGGRVYTSELGDARVATLRGKVEGSGLPQITVVAGEAAGTNFPESGCDGLFMRNVYHHFAEPARMNSSIAAAVAPGGRVAVVDFNPPAGEAPTPAGRAQDGMHGVRAETVARELKDAGLEVISTETGERRWFMVVAARPLSGPG